MSKKYATDNDLDHGFFGKVSSLYSGDAYDKKLKKPSGTSSWLLCAASIFFPLIPLRCTCIWSQSCMICVVVRSDRCLCAKSCSFCALTFLAVETGKQMMTNKGGKNFEEHPPRIFAVWPCIWLYCHVCCRAKHISTSASFA